MKLIPRSLYGRLLATALVATLAALAFAGLAIGAVLEHFVMDGLDQRLDAQIALLATAVGPDGSIDRARIVSPAPYGQPGSGWGWRIDSPAGAVASADMPRIDQPPGPPDPPHRRERRRDDDRPIRSTGETRMAAPAMPAPSRSRAAPARSASLLPPRARSSNGRSAPP